MGKVSQCDIASGVGVEPPKFLKFILYSNQNIFLMCVARARAVLKNKLWECEKTLISHGVIYHTVVVAERIRVLRRMYQRIVVRDMASCAAMKH